MGMGYADVNGTRLYYEEFGTGHPLVLIHGFTLDMRMWDEQVSAFAKDYRVVRYDLRGFGQSALPSGETYTHHEDLRALLTHLDIHQAHLLGLSLGAAVAVSFALNYPQTTSSLTLASPSALPGFMWPDQLKRQFTAINEAARDDNLALAKSRWLDMEWFRPARSNPGLASRLEQIVDDYSGWHFIHHNPVRSVRPSENERLGEVEVPTLILIGQFDLTFYNHPLADRLAQVVRRSKKVVMTGVGHMPNLEDPDRFNEHVQSFLTAQGSYGAKVEPPCSDAAVTEKTGRDWSEWCAVLDAEGAVHLTHKELADLVNRLHIGGEWWSQTVAVGYERFRGKRVVGQKCDGNFSASASKTLPWGAASVHECFVDATKRQRWLLEEIIIRKATAPKSVRITWPDDSSVEVWITEKGETKCSVGIEHTKLPDEAAVARQKEFWKEALGRLAQSME